VLIVGTLAVAPAILSAGSQAPQAPAGGPNAASVANANAPFDFRIDPVTQNLYMAYLQRQIPVVTVFLVTSEGIILADPISPEFSARLRTELASRFPGKPVKWVIETHYHWDHARGGAMFADTATFLGHENLRTNLRAPIAQAPPPGETTDLDGDNQLDRNRESQTATRAQFDLLDKDHSGLISQEELAADVRWPDIVFKDEYTITLGGQHARVIWAKNRHTSDMVDILFPEERVLFAGDYVQGKQLCCGCAFDHRSLTAWINSLKALGQLDFDTEVRSHNPVTIPKADVVASIQWFEDLRAQVSAGIKAGKGLAELQKTLTFDTYKEWAGYNQLPAIIDSAYNSLTRFDDRVTR
jgi:glyoxylase-like metal-dependent hydrolase (beta-lactamase superfamily II)